MRIIETKVFTFDELNEDAKQKAIENMRNSYYEHNDFCSWAIDDCALLEPIEKELIELFGSNYDFPLIKNNRKVYFSLDRDRHIDISKAMEIQNSTQFLQWLGLDEELIEKVDYTIFEDEIEFLNQSDDEFTDEELEKLKQAEEKFHNHCLDILNRLEQNYEYRFTDEAIIEDIECNAYEFTEEGKLI
jgi:hypothetical protein